VSEKQRLDHIVGYPLLQDDPPIDYTSLSEGLACTALPLRQPGRSVNRDYEANPKSTSPNQSIIDAILLSKARTSAEHLSHLTRKTFSTAFDPLAEAAGTESTSLTISSFDRAFSIVTTDLAPYIRIIAAYDLQLESQRLRLSNLLSAGGGRPTKRLRTTRSARASMEGGHRGTTRRERWFDKDVNLSLVLETAGASWAGLWPVSVMDGAKKGDDEEGMTASDADEDGMHE
jgi:hypothetical protein